MLSIASLGSSAWIGEQIGRLIIAKRALACELRYLSYLNVFVWSLSEPNSRDPLRVWCTMYI